MKIKHLIPFLLISLTVFSSFSSYSQNKEYYELKTYTIKNDDQEKRVDAYLKDAYIPALKRMGIENIGVFKVRPDKFKLSDKICLL